MRRITLPWRELAEAEAAYGGDVRLLGNTQLVAIVRSDEVLWDSLPEDVKQWLDGPWPIEPAAAENAKQWCHRYLEETPVTYHLPTIRGQGSAAA